LQDYVTHNQVDVTTSGIAFMSALIICIHSGCCLSDIHTRAHTHTRARGHTHAHTHACTFLRTHILTRTHGRTHGHLPTTQPYGDNEAEGEQRGMDFDEVGTPCMLPFVRLLPPGFVCGQKARRARTHTRTARTHSHRTHTHTHTHTYIHTHPVICRDDRSTSVTLTK
jgi:hypothetical protein